MKVKELYDRYGWVQGNWAVDIMGRACDYKSSKANSFCLVGAVARCYDNESTEVLEKIKQYLNIGKGGEGSIMLWNDKEDRTFEDVEEVVNKLDI